MGASIPTTASFDFVLFNGADPVVEAHVMWQRLAFFYVIVDSAEGTFHVHMDLMDTARKSVAWKAGMLESIAGFTLESEGSFTTKGWIATANGRNLAWAPTHNVGYKYAIFQPGAAQPR